MRKNWIIIKIRVMFEIRVRVIDGVRDMFGANI